jgi:hypothetical protein
LAYTEHSLHSRPGRRTDGFEMLFRSYCSGPDFPQRRILLLAASWRPRAALPASCRSTPKVTLTLTGYIVSAATNRHFWLARGSRYLERLVLLKRCSSSSLASAVTVDGPHRSWRWKKFDDCGNMLFILVCSILAQLASCQGLVHFGGDWDQRHFDNRL